VTGRVDPGLGALYHSCESGPANRLCHQIGHNQLRGAALIRWSAIARRPHIRLRDVVAALEEIDAGFVQFGELNAHSLDSAEIELKYRAYVSKELQHIERARAMEDAGAKVSEIQARLGHDSLATTGRYLWWRLGTTLSSDWSFDAVLSGILLDIYGARAILVAGSVTLLPV